MLADVDYQNARNVNFFSLMKNPTLYGPVVKIHESTLRRMEALSEQVLIFYSCSSRQKHGL